MPFYHRIFFSSIIKKTFQFVGLFLFFLPLLSCSFYKPTIFKTDFSTAEIKTPTLSFVNDDDIFSAVAQINIHQQGSFYTAKMALIIKRPSYVRLELIPIIGVPDFFLTVSPGIMKIFIPSKGEFYSGQPTAANLKKFLPWPMEIEDMIMVFTGSYPSFKENNIAYQKHQEDDVYVIEMNAPSGASQIIWLSNNNKLLKLIRKDQTGEELYNVKYTYGDDLSIPEKITVKIAKESVSFSVKYSDVKIEKMGDVSIFDLAIPENTKEFILE